jgi:hypothetical protein
LALDGDLATYLQGKSPWYPLDRRLGGPKSWSGCSGEEKNSQPLLGLEHPIIQPVAHCYTTELSWFPTVTVTICNIFTKEDVEVLLQIVLPEIWGLS